MTVHAGSITIPCPVAPQEAATGCFTVPFHELGGWAGSSLGSHQFLPKLKSMGCADEVTGVLDNPSSGKRLFEARKADSRAPSAGSTGSPSLGWVSPALSTHLVFL